MILIRSFVIFPLKIMSKTYKDKPDKYQEIKRKPKGDRRFESSKGRKAPKNLKSLYMNDNLKDS